MRDRGHERSHGATLAVGVMAVGSLLFAASCVSYSSVSKAADGKFYLSGATSYFIVTVPFIKRCDLDGVTLKCEDLAEEPPKRMGPAPDADAGAAPAPAPAAAPAVVDAGKPAPAK